MKTRLQFLGIWFLLLGVGMTHAQTDQLFDQGNQKYAAGQYQEAINAWSKIVEQGFHDANVYYNLGNAHYKLNNVGPSVYFYEKALQLDPLDRDIKNNLAFAENARVDAIEPLPKTVFSKWYGTLSGLFTYNGWAWIAVVCTLLYSGLFLMYYFSVFERRKRLYFIFSGISIWAAIISLFLAFQTYAAFENDKPAIIFAESTEVKSGPSMGSESAFILHEGTKVQIIALDNNWVQIEVADGKEGWMPTADLKRL